MFDIFIGMRLKLTPEASLWRIESCSLSFGGMAPITKIATLTSTLLAGKEFNELSMREAMLSLAEEMKLPEAVPGGQSEYRTTLCVSFLWRSFVKICRDLSELIETNQVEGRIMIPVTFLPLIYTPHFNTHTLAFLYLSYVSIYLGLLRLSASSPRTSPH